MNHLDALMERNQHFAAQASAGHTPMPSLPQALPHVKAIIIGCADMRVDPCACTRCLVPAFDGWDRE